MDATFSVRCSALMVALELYLFGCGRSEDALLTSGPDAAPACAGHAALFDGSSYLRVDRPVSDDFTLEAWIQTTESRSGSSFYHGSGLMYADAAPGANPLGANDFGSSVLNERFAFGVGNPDTTLESSTPITTGEWVHVAATRRMATGENRLLVNGVVEGSVVSTQLGSLIDQPEMRFGNTTLDDLFYGGLMEEVRIWNAVRSPREIRETMHRELVGDEVGLVLYLKFDDVGGPNQADSSSSEQVVTITGPLDWVESDAPVCDGPLAR